MCAKVNDCSVIEKQSNEKVPENAKNGINEFTYEEAIELTGNGRYNISLLITMSLALCSMGLDMFGFSVVVTGCSCEFQLTQSQRSILNSVPFVGPVLTAYLWGYQSDTRGRRGTLLIAMCLSFVFSSMSTLSPNWMVLATLKLIATSFSSCAQSATYTLLGESCDQRVRGTYMLILSSMLQTTPIIIYGVGYFILGSDLSFDLGFIQYTSWRVHALLLTSPLFFGALLLLCHYESPKFLLNAGREDEAIQALRGIYRRNGFNLENYPVKRIISEEGVRKVSDQPLLKSVWEQTAPLFRPPLLKRTMQLFYLTAVVYGTGNGTAVWFPFVVNSFYAKLRNGGSTTSDFCTLINYDTVQNNVNNDTATVIPTPICVRKLEDFTVYTALSLGVTLVVINLVISMLSAYKKIVTIIIFTVSSAGAVGVALSPEPTSAIMFYLLFMFCCLGIGMMSAYYVELFPTSYRGMIACLSVIVARSSTLVGVNLFGSFIHTHCQMTFFVGCAYVLSGVLMTTFLPKDTLIKKAT